jgi:SAM-dependent methyltransferase
MSVVKGILAEIPKAWILEIGAGCLRNSIFLRAAGHPVTVLEIKGVEDRFADQYVAFRRAGGRVIEMLPRNQPFDVVLATFVIETICDPGLRRRLIKGARRCLRPEGHLIMSVRGPSDLHTADNSGVRCSDGYITPNLTFSRAFPRRQLQNFLKTCGFNGCQFLHRSASNAPELLHVVAK